MFRCQMCGSVVPAGMRANKIVVASRPRTYPSRGGGDRGGFRGRFREPKPEYDKGGTGREIVRELAVCDRCAKLQVVQSSERDEASDQWVRDDKSPGERPASAGC